MEGARLHFSNTPKNVIRDEIRGPATLTFCVKALAEEVVDWVLPILAVPARAAVFTVALALRPAGAHRRRRRHAQTACIGMSTGNANRQLESKIENEFHIKSSLLGISGC